MGNLYTRIIKRPNDKRINILSELKNAWNTFPRDMKLIQQLQDELKSFDIIEPINYRKKYGVFSWKAEQTGGQR